MVPESATAIISGDLADLDSKLAAFTAAYSLNADAETLENGQVQVTVIGKSAHGSTPEEGVNGATYLAKFLSQFAFDGAAKAYLDLAGQVLLEDHDGQKLGVAIYDEQMGALSMNAGVFKFDETSSDNTIALNFRYPKIPTQKPSRLVWKNWAWKLLACLSTVILHIIAQSMTQWSQPSCLFMKNTQA